MAEIINHGDHGSEPPEQRAEIADARHLVRFLAVFHRGFKLSSEYSKSEDREGMWMTSWLFRQIHNVPCMLTGGEVGGCPYTPVGLDAGLRQFPEFVRRFGVSERIVADSARATTANGVAEELGLVADDLRVVLPPPDIFCEYADVLHGASLALRNYKYDALRDWEDRDTDHGLRGGWLASALQPIPRALVSWSEFDESQYCSELARRGYEVVDILGSRASRFGAD